MGDVDRAVLVTGATGALGTAVCRALLQTGARVHATYRRDEEAVRFDTRFASQCERYVLHRVELADERQVRKLFTNVEKREPLEALVHAAGGFMAASIEQTTPAMFDNLVALNLRSLFLCCRESVKRMRPRGRGRLIAVGARAALEPRAGVAAYAASKAGLHAFVQSLAEELRGSGVTVHAVIPSIIDTPANRRAMPKAETATWVTPEAIANVIRSLLSEELAVASGALLPVYGG